MEPLIFNLLLFSACAYAWLRGGAPERFCALAFVVATVLTVVAARPQSQRFFGTEYGIVAVDLALLLVLIILAIRANRLWPMVMAAMQLVSVAGHLTVASSHVIPWAYATIIALWSYPMLLLLMLGTWRHARRVRQFGSEPSWKASSARSHPSTPRTGPNA